MAKNEVLEINISQIRLDVKNPRHDIVSSEREAILAMLEEQKEREKILNLARDIILEGVNPSDLPIVVPHNEDKKKYIVLEGNRRITALKLLFEPSLASTQNSHFKKRFQELSKEFRPNTLKKLNCVVFQKREDANRWVELKHTGENQGVGTVTWGATENARFKERLGQSSIPLQAIKFVKQNAKLDNETKDKIDLISITNLNRLLGDKYVQSALGFYIQDGKLTTDLQKKEALKGLSKIALDLANRKIKVSDIYHKNNRKDYIEQFNRNEIPDHSQKTKEAWSLDTPSTQIPNDKPKSGSGGKKSLHLSIRRKTLIPSSCVLKIKEKKINSIYRELKSIEVDDFANASAILVRVFLEASLDHYIDSNKLKNISTNSKLASKLQVVANHLEKNKNLNKDRLKPIKAAVSNPNGLFSINTLHAYVHSRHYQPIPSELKTTWDNMQFFMEKVWE